MAEEDLVFEPGDLIFKSEPFLAVLDKRWRFQKCDRCFCDLPPLPSPSFPCPKCNCVFYCGEKCRKIAWEGDGGGGGGAAHKEECKVMQRTKGHLSDNARLMLSLLLLLRSRGRNPHEDIPSLGLRRGFSRLESHSSELSGCGRRAAAVEAVREELKEAGFEEVPGREHFLKLCGKVLINSFSRPCDTSSARLCASLHLAASVLDHSCRPNAAFAFDPEGRLAVRALKEVILRKGQRVEEKVRISYLDLMDSTRSRRSKLVSRYFFECDCPRCQSESSAAVKGGGDPPSFFSLRCQWDGCSGRPVRVGPGENEEELGEGAKGCGVCGRRPDRRTLSRYVSSCDLARSVLDGGGAMDPERCLSELTGLLHPNHFLYARVARRAFHHRAIAAASGPEAARSARELGLLCLATYEKLEPYSLPALGPLLLRIGRLEMEHFQGEETEDEDKEEEDEEEDEIKLVPVWVLRLRRASSALRTTHGEEHPLYQEAQTMLLKHDDQ